MECYLDVMPLEPPEPMERILNALDGMPAGDWLRVRLRREPFPLYNVLRSMDMAWRGFWTEDRFELLIWHRGAQPPA